MVVEETSAIKRRLKPKRTGERDRASCGGGRVRRWSPPARGNGPGRAAGTPEELPVGADAGATQFNRQGLPGYLAEFTYRSKNRNLENLFAATLARLARTTTLPFRALVSSE